MAILLAATCVDMPKRLGAVLLMGESGSGKSDLALRLIMEHEGSLVGDDQVAVAREGKRLIASAGPRLKGHLEVRGVGIFNLLSRRSSKVALAVKLVADPKSIERLPRPESIEIAGISLPLIRLYAFEASAACKVKAALHALRDGSMTVGAFKE